MKLTTKITLGALMLTAGLLIAAASSGNTPTCSEHVTKRELRDILLPRTIPNRNNINMSISMPVQMNESDTFRECKGYVNIKNIRSGEVAKSQWRYTVQKTEDGYNYLEVFPEDEEAFLWLLLLNQLSGDNT